MTVEELDEIKERVINMKQQARTGVAADILAIEIAFQDTPALIEEVERLQQFEQKAIYAIEENRKLRDALKFYADNLTYVHEYFLDGEVIKATTPITVDSGEIARKVLDSK